MLREVEGTQAQIDALLITNPATVDGLIPSLQQRGAVASSSARRRSAMTPSPAVAAQDQHVRRLDIDGGPAGIE